jgi:hypothetical protein
VSRFDGLNLPQLMELMHAPVVPEPIAWLPSTPGWWVALAWVVALAIIALRHLLARRRQGRYRREASAHLDEIAARATDDPARAAGEISALLKRTALAVYPRDEVAGLYGDAWASFLVSSSGNDKTIRAAADDLAAATFRPDADGPALVAPARRWIRRHRV